MTPISFPQSNKDLIKPDSMTDKECGTLPVFTNGNQCISCWSLSDDDIERIKRTGRVWLSVHSGPTQPPVMVSSEFPFDECKLSGELTIELLAQMVFGSVFATGRITPPEHVNEARWVAISGRGYNDWAIYYYASTQSVEWIAKNGSKVIDEKLIRSLVPCTDEAYALYRK